MALPVLRRSFPEPKGWKKLKPGVWLSPAGEEVYYTDGPGKIDGVSGGVRLYLVERWYMQRDAQALRKMAERRGLVVVELKPNS